MKRYMQIGLVVIVAFSMLLGIGCQAPKPVVETPGVVQKPQMLVWGSASLGSQGYVIIEALVSTANRNVGFKSASISTAGGAENLVLLDQGEIQLGQATSSDLFNAYNGAKPYDKKIEFSQVFAYGAWPLAIVVPDTSTIRTFEDLSGKKLHIGPAAGAAVPMMKRIIELHGMTDNITLVFGSWTEAANALKLGQVDATALNHMAGTLIPSAFQELAMTKPFRPIIYNRGILETISAENEGVKIGDIPKGLFPTYSEDTIAPAITGVLTASPGLDSDMIYELTKALYEKAEDVRKIAPELKMFELPWGIDGMVASYPVHPGSARYFKEIGIWKEGMIIGK